LYLSYDTTTDEGALLFKSSSTTKPETKNDQEEKAVLKKRKESLFAKVTESPEEFMPSDNDCNNNFQLLGNAFTGNVMSASSVNHSPSTPLVSSSLASTPNHENKSDKKVKNSTREDSRFKMTAEFLNSYLENLVHKEVPFNNKEQNRLTLEVILLFCHELMQLNQFKYSIKLGC
jgi:hypothetical protein